jgi:hypothetical protein
VNQTRAARRACARSPRACGPWRRAGVPGLPPQVRRPGGACHKQRTTLLPGPAWCRRDREWP